MSTNENAPRRTLVRRIAAGSILTLIAALIAVLAIGEVRNLLLYAVAPRYARDANLVRLQKGAVEVTLLGTIHGRHLSTRDYALQHLKAVLVRLRPDLVLVESRPEEVDRGRWGDGPIEMPYVALTARALDIPVNGIDWWQLENAGLRRTDANRDDRIFRNLVDRLPVCGKALVVIGYAHVPELAQRLEREGYERAVVRDDEKHSLFAPMDERFAYPAGMRQAIRERIEAAEAQANAHPGEVAAQLGALIDARRQYLQEIERVGELPPSEATGAARR